VGPKTATELLRRFGSVEVLLGRLGEIKSDPQRANLLGAADDLRRNRRMIALRSDLEGGPELGALAPAPADIPALRVMYRDWGFRSLLTELGPLEPATQGDLF
jgi:DNA polymerase-1